MVLIPKNIYRDYLVVSNIGYQNKTKLKKIIRINLLCYCLLIIIIVPITTSVPGEGYSRKPSFALN